jgi:DNA-binding NtrC family response regulator
LTAALFNQTVPQNLDQYLGDLEKNMLAQALTQTRGVQKQAAKLLGIKERSLWHRLKKYNIDVANYKN